MWGNSKGQIIVPTGGGKTMCMIDDALLYLTGRFKTVVVVAPRILLAEQLSSEFLEVIKKEYQFINVLHVHSGETHHFSTTNADEIREWDKVNGNKFIFTTYHSLHRIQEAEIEVDTIYFDEAHNSVQKNFVEATEYQSMYANRCYFFTATPKHSKTPFKIGMNDYDIYGRVLVNVPAPKLVDEGVILPPKVTIKKIDVVDDSRFKHEHDCDHVVSTIDEIDIDKVLICARSTKQIVNLVSQSDFCIELRDRGYSWMYITAKTGAVVDGKKVDRESFFNTLNEWGKDDTKKFVIFHYSILSEGINVPGLTHSVMLRNLPTIEMAQTIGRVIRIHEKDRVSMKEGKIPAGQYNLYHKSFGQIVVPMTGKYGERIAKRLQSIVSYIFIEGIPPRAYV